MTRPHGKTVRPSNDAVVTDDHLAPAERARLLRERIDEANYRYHVLDAPAIDDAVYDALLHDLASLESERPDLVTPESPTQRVGGAAVSSLPEYRHVVPMLSLANAFDEADLHRFDERVAKLAGAPPSYVCELKIDGLAISLRYVNGALAAAGTRGDGSVGEDVTHNVRTIRQIPARLRGAAPPAEIDVRGEIYLTKSDFVRLNETREREGRPLFATPRNTAAGGLRQQDSRLTAERRLSFFAYAVGAFDAPEAAIPRTQTELLRRLGAFGFPVNAHATPCATIGEVAAFCRRWETERDGLDYEIDGVVIKLDDLALQAKLGFAGKDPRWAIAFKFKAREARTVLRAIGINVSRSGKLNPFAELDPVPIGGVTVKMATLHNEDDIRRKDIRVGDTVVVHRAGDVIPYVEGPVPELRPAGAVPFVMPSRCPVCGEPAIRAEGDVFSYCTNGACPAQRRERVRHFCSRGAMDIEGMGDVLSAAVVDAGLVHDVAEIYDLTAARLETLPRMGRKSASAVAAAIEGSKPRGLARVLTGLGIRMVGSTNAAVLAGAFGAMAPLAAAPEDELAAIDGIGPEIARSVAAFFAVGANRAIVAGLAARGLDLTAPLRPRDAVPQGPLAGKTLVVTGTLPTLSREEAEALIVAAGGKAGSAVSKKTSYLVAGENAGSKLEKAGKLEIPVIDEEALRALVAPGGDVN